MIAILKAEMYRFFHSKKNLALLFIGMCLTSYIAWDYQKQDIEYLKNQKEMIANEVSNASSLSATLAVMLKSNPSEEGQEQLEYLWKFVENGSYIKGYYTNPNIHTPSDFLKMRLQHDTYMLEGIEKNYDVPMQYNHDEQISFLNERIAMDTFMIEHNIEPYHSPYEMNASNFFVKLFENGVPLYFVFLLLIMLYDVYIKEFESGAYKFVFTLPLTRSQTYFSKLIVTLFQTCILLCTSIIPVLLVLLMVNGAGSLSYPIWIVGNDMMVTSAYLVQMIVLFLLYFMFIAIDIYAISVYSPSLSVLFMMFGGIMVFVYCIYTMSGMHFLPSQYIPFFYCYGTEILQHKTEISVLFASGLLVCCSTILILLPYHLFVQQDLIE